MFILAVAIASVEVAAMAAGPPEWIAPGARAASGPEPRWIWVAADVAHPPTTKGAPVGVVRVSTSFMVPAGVRGAVLGLVADNSAVASINGAVVLESTDWSAPVVMAVAVREGLNELSIEARNGSGDGGDPAGMVNPGGVAARLGVMGADGVMTWVVSDGSWKGSAERGEGGGGGGAAWGQQVAVTDLGPSSTAPWGVKAGAFEPVPPCPVLRRSFTLAEAPGEATIRIIGLGHYQLRCNGAVVGDTVINQSWSQYDKGLYWQDFDLSGHLRAGENVLAVALGNSFWRVDAANDAHEFTKTDAMPDFSMGQPYVMRADAAIYGAGVPLGDPSAVHVVTDGEWKWNDGPVTFSNVYAGEDYDARLAQPGWDMPGFDDSAWQSAIVAEKPKGLLRPLKAPGMKRFETFTTSDVRTIDAEGGIFTYVFPQNCSALLRFSLDGGHAGSRVRFRPCEFMEPSGRVKFTYTWGTGKDIWLDYTKSGDGLETHEPLFFYVGAQFVQVEGAVPEGAENPRGLPVLRSLELVHVRAACATVGEFECDSPMHEAAARLIDWSIRSNMSHVPTDCPHREKNGWLEQDWHMARAMSYRYDVSEWLGKTCQDIRDAQQPDGHIPTNSPNYLIGVPPHGFWNNAPEWGIAGVLVPWHLYEWYGDSDIVRSSYESARKYVDYLSSTAVDGAITSNLGDWYDFGHGKGNGPSQWTPNEVSATAMWAAGADTLARMATVVGRAEDAARYRALFTQIRADFQRRFYDSTTHTVKNNGSCQAGTAAALCIGLIPEEDRAGALAAIVADLESRSWKQTPGEVLQIFLIRALAEGGRGDVLHRIYNREDIPSYGHMVKSGLTTLPESWDARRGTGDSLNHFMLGQLMEWHFAYVAGLRQDVGSLGWNKVLIAPQPPPSGDGSPNAIHRAAATFESPRGRVSCRWEINPAGAAGEFVLTCEIPAGVAATAVMPDGMRQSLKAGRTTLRQAWR